MYLHIGQSVVIPSHSIVGIFDLDNATQSHLTRRFLEQAEREGRLKSIGEELPKSFIVCRVKDETQIYFSQISSATLLRRAEENGIE
jgi:hypothetical protein